MTEQLHFHFHTNIIYCYLTNPESRRSPGEGHGNALQYSCPESPHGQRSLAGYSPRGREESDTKAPPQCTDTSQCPAQIRLLEIRLGRWTFLAPIPTCWVTFFRVRAQTQYEKQNWSFFFVFSQWERTAILPLLSLAGRVTHSLHNFPLLSCAFSLCLFLVHSMGQSVHWDREYLLSPRIYVLWV